MWRGRFYRALPALLAAHTAGRWIFLTLTVRNCPIDELRDTLAGMNAAWNRLRLRREFRPVLGWIRTTEVTRGKDGSAHPHFHTLLLVPSSMLAGPHYVKQARWVDLWRECARLDYPPVVDVRAVRGDDPDRVREAALQFRQLFLIGVGDYGVGPLVLRQQLFQPVELVAAEPDGRRACVAVVDEA